MDPPAAMPANLPQELVLRRRLTEPLAQVMKGDGEHCPPPPARATDQRGLAALPGRRKRGCKLAVGAV